MERIPVGVLGATGTVGQKFILQLANHPWFEITELAASERSAGKTYQEAVNWKQPLAIPEKVRSMPVKACEPGLDCKLVFSGLDASVAGEIEKAFAENGYWVFSNARNYRMFPDVPLIITEINADHFGVIPAQKKGHNWSGAIVTNANCSAIVLALSLGPLHSEFGLEKVNVVTLQAISGAGYPGVASLDILGNVIPFIGGEEEKIESETQKILGSFEDGQLKSADFVVSAQANRVPVEEGHTECVSIKLRTKASVEDLKNCWRKFRGQTAGLDLPSAPESPVVLLEEKDRPQPRLDVWKYNGMSSLVGRVRPCPVMDFKYVVLGHNTIRGAAGASVLNAEYAAKKGLIS